MAGKEIQNTRQLFDDSDIATERKRMQLRSELRLNEAMTDAVVWLIKWIPISIAIAFVIVAGVKAFFPNINVSIVESFLSHGVVAVISFAGGHLKKNNISQEAAQ